MRRRFSKTTDFPFPPCLYYIDELVLTMVPNRPGKGCVYSRLQQFQSSYNDMQKKLVMYRDRRQYSIGQSLNSKSFTKYSLLTRSLVIEINDEENFEKDESMLDMPVLDTTYDDYSFFPKEKMSSNSMKATDLDRRKQDELSAKNHCYSTDQMTLADLTENVLRHKKTSKNKTEQPLRWDGKVRLLNRGLN